jgi:hypothetical protein
VFPRFNRIEFGSSNRISFANCIRRDDGSRDVVIIILGSTIPESASYSSSIKASSPSGCDSSYLKSFRRSASLAISFGSGYSAAQSTVPLQGRLPDAANTPFHSPGLPLALLASQRPGHFVARVAFGRESRACGISIRRSDRREHMESNLSRAFRRI